MHRISAVSLSSLEESPTLFLEEKAGKGFNGRDIDIKRIAYHIAAFPASKKVYLITATQLPNLSSSTSCCTKKEIVFLVLLYLSPANISFCKVDFSKHAVKMDFSIYLIF